MLKRRQFLKFSPSRPPTSTGYWLHISRPIMACRFEVTLPLGDPSGVALANHALNEAARLEQQLTIFRETSEVSFVNRHAASQAIRLSPSLLDLLRLCQTLSHATDGAFDITSKPLSDCWGFLRRQGRVPEPAEIEAAKSRVGSDKVWLDPESGSIRFTRPGVEVNLGSIGKGYALDRLAGLMNQRGRAGLLSAGASSIRAIGSGDRNQAGWAVGLRHPRQPDRRLAVLRLRDCAMATSGGEEQFFEVEGKRYGHVIDPRTGWPAERVSSVTVVTPSAAVADALATAFFVGGPELAESYCAAHAEVLAIMLESAAERPLVFGNNHQCEVQISD